MRWPTLVLVIAWGVFVSISLVFKLNGEHLPRWVDITAFYGAWLYLGWYFDVGSWLRGGRIERAWDGLAGAVASWIDRFLRAITPDPHA